MHGLLSGRTEFVAKGKVVSGADLDVVRPATVHLPLLDYGSILVTHSVEIRRQIGEFRPDCILGFGLLNASAGIRLARKEGIPFVYYLIDELHRLVPESLLRGIARIIEQANVRRASLVLSINRRLNDYAISMGALPRSVRVLPAGVDLEWVASGDRRGVRERHGIRNGDLVLLFMGWVYPFSGIREVAQTLLDGGVTNPRVILLVVGKGDSWPELVRLVEKHDAADRIKLVDFRPYEEIPSYLAAADVCLLPAQGVETMQNIVPIKMYEYLGAGKPVIATRLPGLLAEFGEGHGVVYVDGPHAVVARASAFFQDGNLKKFGEAGRLFVSGNDWGRITDTFESWLKELVEHQTARTEASALG